MRRRPSAGVWRRRGKAWKKRRSSSNEEEEVLVLELLPLQWRMA
jgi:hypothetical protein